MLSVHNFFTRIAAAAPAALSLVGTATNTSLFSAFTVTVPFPAGTTTGDLVIVVAALANDIDSVGGNFNLNPVVGYTTAGFNVTGNYVSGYCAYKRLTAADTSVTVSSTGPYPICATVMVIRGTHATTPVTVTTGDNSPTSGAINSPSVVPTIAGSWVISAGASSFGSSGMALSSLTGYTNIRIGALGQNNTWYAQSAIARKAWISGSENPPAWTYTGAGPVPQSVAYTLAVRPA